MNIGNLPCLRDWPHRRYKKCYSNRAVDCRAKRERFPQQDSEKQKAKQRGFVIRLKNLIFNTN